MIFDVSFLVQIQRELSKDWLCDAYKALFYLFDQLDTASGSDGSLTRSFGNHSNIMIFF